MRSLSNNDLIYGTAWKEELTASCVFSAIKLGYRAIDSANQRKHYNEEGVGEALASVQSKLGVSRSDLFIQSKFTYAAGQDHRKPYDENSPLQEQVKASFSSSLKKLKTDYLDSYLLHGPSSNVGLTDDDLQAWKTMEDLCRSGKTKHIGVANISKEQLAALLDVATIKPSFVQNRCLAQSRWDQDVRKFCQANGIQYQGFSLLTNNWKYIGGTILRPETRTVPQLVFADDGSSTEGLRPVVKDIVESVGQPVQRVIFRFAQQLGMIPILGTRSETHMKMNLNLRDFNLSNDQLERLENIAFSDFAPV